jgi:hypothetical protein
MRTSHGMLSEKSAFQTHWHAPLFFFVLEHTSFFSSEVLLSSVFCKFIGILRWTTGFSKLQLNQVEDSENTAAMELLA